MTFLCSERSVTCRLFYILNSTLLYRITILYCYNPSVNITHTQKLSNEDITLDSFFYTFLFLEFSFYYNFMLKSSFIILNIRRNHDVCQRRKQDSYATCDAALVLHKKCNGCFTNAAHVKTCLSPLTYVTMNTGRGYRLK